MDRGTSGIGVQIVAMVFLGLFLPARICRAQSFNGGFNFYLPPQDTASNQFLPVFPAKPIVDFVLVDPSGHFSVAGSRIRFFGTNVVADGAFPTKGKSWFVSGRLRKMGFNLVRFHHMDNPWSAGSLFEQGSDTRHLNPSTLDRLEFFLAELKKNGVYADINLHVSRTFRPADGVAGADSLPQFGKGVTYFDPQLIALQKEFATQLLTHRNPYTGLPLGEDPVMGMVEITNENSLYRMWREGGLRPFSAGGSLMVRHALLLDSLWQHDLSSRYGNTSNLAAAWNSGIFHADSTEMIRNGNFEQPISSPWVLEQNAPGQGVVSRDVTSPYDGSASARVQVTQSDGTDWRVQWKQIGLSMKTDSTYVIRFAARSDSARNISAAVMLDASPWTGYSWTDIALTTSWKYYAFSFRAPVSVNGGLRLSFQLGAAKGLSWFDNVSFAMTGTKGLLPEESLEAKTVRRIDFSECVQFTDQRVRDLTGFYLKLQEDYFAEMTSHLKGTLHVRVPIVGTNWNVGVPDLAVQSKMDYTDNHAYWDHPSFPGEPWSATDWAIANQPMVKADDGGAIASLFSGPPFSGKPSTMSEYNHAFPNRYQSEAVPFLTAYASLQDVDGVMFFDYNGATDDWETDKVGGYFDIHRNTALMSLMPSCAFAYRNFLIAPARQFLTLHYSHDDVLLQAKKDGGQWNGWRTFPEKLALRYGVRIATFDAGTPLDLTSLPPVPVSPYRSDTDEIVWNTAGILSVSTPRFAALTGFLQNFPEARAGDMTVVGASEHATLTWISLTDRALAHSASSLLTLSTKLQNAGMLWDGINTIHNNWGNPPTQMYPVTASLRLHIQADSIHVLPLRANGVPLGGSVTYVAADTNTFAVSVDHNRDLTTWYGVQAFGKGTVTATPDESPQVPSCYSLRQNFPNPFNPSTTLTFTVPGGARQAISLRVFDLLGREVAVLYQGEMEPGTYTSRFDAATLSSGVYFCRLTAGSFTVARRMMLTR
jgi:hypothetical protein